MSQKTQQNLTQKYVLKATEIYLTQPNQISEAFDLKYFHFNKNCRKDKF